MNKGLYDQIKDSDGNIQAYVDLSLDSFTEFCLKLQTPKEYDGRKMIIHTSKSGAIDMYIKMYEYTYPSEEDIAEYRKQLEAELKEGLYRIDSGSMDDFIMYLGNE